MSAGRLVIRNLSAYPADEVRALVRFAGSDVDTRGVCVNVKNRRKSRWQGYAYDGVPIQSNAPRSAHYLVTLAVNPDNVYPLTRSAQRRGEPVLVLHDWRELIVFLAAHELKHVEQFRESLRLSEVRCNLFAAHMLTRFRAANREAVA